MTVLVAERGVRQRQLVRVATLGAAFAAAVALRVGVGGTGVAQSATAGLVFAACLALLCVADRSEGTGRAVPEVRSRAGWSSTGVGLLGAAVICAPAMVSHALAGTISGHGMAGFAPWAVVVTVVATAEEAFLRGAFFDAVHQLSGPGAAILTAALLFGLLHVPLYGWHALPLDVAVGVVLGGLRAWIGTWRAPAVAHVAADLAGWFLR